MSPELLVHPLDCACRDCLFLELSEAEFVGLLELDHDDYLDDHPEEVSNA